MNGLKPNPIDELFPVLLSNVKSSIASCFSWRNKILFKFNGFSQILFNHLAKAQLFFNLQMNGLKPNPIDELFPALAVHFINCLLL